MEEIVSVLIDKGSLGILVIILVYGIHRLDQRMHERTDKDMDILKAIEQKLNEGNKLFELMVQEHQTTREFFKSTVEHERITSSKCYDIIHKTQLVKKEILAEIKVSLSSLHKRIDELINKIKQLLNKRDRRGQYINRDYIAIEVDKNNDQSPDYYLMGAPDGIYKLSKTLLKKNFCLFAAIIPSLCILYPAVTLLKK